VTGEIWVYADTLRGELSEATGEALALGRELGGEPVLLVLKSDSQSACVDAMGRLVRDRRPRAVLVPLSNVTMGFGTMLGARLGAPVVNFCTGARVAGGRLEVDCLLYGGKIQLTVTPLGEPAILGLWPGMRRPQPPGPVEEIPVPVPEEPSVRLLRYLEPEAGAIDLTKLDVLVGVGRGIQSQDNLELAEELAQALGGAVCGSRPVIDQGWMPLSRQVGKSGATVKPKLYIAAGISGAPEHAEGMRNAQLIVAINTDPQAPIFQIAHYGVAGDCLDLLPALTAAVKARREHSCPTP
jgi:electron transfer flavoprotein alpha subunit